MSVVTQVLRRSNSLWSILLVSVLVALVSTLAGSVLDQIHQVDAEELIAHQVSATPGPDATTQILTIQKWRLQVVLPLAAEVPLIHYADQGSSSIGLSSAVLADRHPACQARHNALGAVLRLPKGSSAIMAQRNPRLRHLISDDQYDYAYERPRTACTDIPGNHTLVNQQAAALTEHLPSLAPIQP